MCPLQVGALALAVVGSPPVILRGEGDERPEVDAVVDDGVSEI